MPLTELWVRQKGERKGQKGFECLQVCDTRLRVPYQGNGCPHVHVSCSSDVSREADGSPVGLSRRDDVMTFLFDLLSQSINLEKGPRKADDFSYLHKIDFY